MIIPFYSARYVGVEHVICCDRGKKQRDYTFMATSLFRDCSLIRGFYCSYHRLYTLQICIIVLSVNFDAQFNCYAITLCFCGGMRTRVHYVYWVMIIRVCG